MSNTISPLKDKIKPIVACGVCFELMLLYTFGVILSVPSTAPFISHTNLPVILLVFLIALALIVFFWSLKLKLNQRWESNQQEEDLAKEMRSFTIPMKDQFASLFAETNQFKVVEAAQIMGIAVKEMKHFLYKLAGENQVAGEFLYDDTIFQLNSSTDDFIRALDDQFRGWFTAEQSSKGKKV